MDQVHIPMLPRQGPTSMKILYTELFVVYVPSVGGRAPFF